jgi:hypothetical protein
MAINPISVAAAPQFFIIIFLPPREYQRGDNQSTPLLRSRVAGGLSEKNLAIIVKQGLEFSRSKPGNRHRLPMISTSEGAAVLETIKSRKDESLIARS